MKPNKLEVEIIKALAEIDDEKSCLLQQLSSSEVIDRDYSGVGVFTQFNVSSKAIKLGPERVKLEDFPTCYLHHPHLESGAGVILWITDGVIDTLECFTYGGDWPVNDSLFVPSLHDRTY